LLITLLHEYRRISAQSAWLFLKTSAYKVAETYLYFVLGTLKGFFNKVIRKQECQSYKKEGTVKCCIKIEKIKSPEPSCVKNGR
jgi:hypothetical protein